jgi:hypothetical protein
VKTVRRRFVARTIVISMNKAALLGLAFSPAACRLVGRLYCNSRDHRRRNTSYIVVMHNRRSIEWSSCGRWLASPTADIRFQSFFTTCKALIIRKQTGVGRELSKDHVQQIRVGLRRADFLKLSRVLERRCFHNS